MDDLWQRYRTFFTPVLIGLGVFLVGLIAVHVMTDDPAVWRSRVAGRRDDLERKVEPPAARIKDVQTNGEALTKRVVDWAKRVDQAALEDPIEYAVASSLQSALLRGVDPERLRASISGGDPVPVQVFEGDAVAASKALTRYELVRDDRLSLLRTGDPNVGFSRLLNDIWSELRVRANRADVELKADVLGFSTVKSVTRASLTQRLLNLALVSEVVNLGILSGLESVDDIRFENRANPEGPDVFLREWPVSLTLSGDMASIRPILDLVTSPERATPVLQASLAQPRRGNALEGVVELNLTISSALVRPAASLDLDTEEER